MTTPELRVLLVIRGLDIGGNSGGAENFGLRLARHLRRMGAAVSLCAYYQFDTLVERVWQRRLEEEGIPCFFAVPAGHIQLVSAVRHITRFVRAHKIALIHSHFQVGTIAALGVKLLNPGVRVLRTAHIPYEFGLTLAARLARPLFVGLIYPLAVDLEMGNSKTLSAALDRRLLARLLSRSAETMVNAPADALDEYPMPDEAPFTLRPASAWLITSVGLLTARKCFDTLIQAMPAVIRAVPHAQLVLVGKGPEEQRLRKMAEDLGIARQVWFLGQRDDVPAILRNSDVFVLASRDEALPTVVLEAMLNGVPVIATDIPGTAELVQDGVQGLLFPVGDSASLAERIVRLYRTPELAQSLVQQAAQTMQRYRMSATAERHLALYRALMGKP